SSIPYLNLAEEIRGLHRVLRSSPVDCALRSVAIQPDVNFLAFDFDLMRANVFRSGHGNYLASAIVKSRAMARANDVVSVHGTLAQGAAVVRANIVDTVKLAVDVKKHHH